MRAVTSHPSSSLGETVHSLTSEYGPNLIHSYSLVHEDQNEKLVPGYVFDMHAVVLELQLASIAHAISSAGLMQHKFVHDWRQQADC